MDDTQPPADPATRALDAVTDASTAEDFGTPQEDALAEQAAHDGPQPGVVSPIEGTIAPLAPDVPTPAAGSPAAETPVTDPSAPVVAVAPKASGPRALGIDPAVEERRLRAERHWQAVVAAKQTGATFVAVVSSTTNGGLLVDVGGVRGFLPASQTRVEGDAPLASLISSKLAVTIVDVDLNRRRVVVSQRRALEAARRGRRAELLGSLAIGQTHEATVVRLVPFGAFVDIGGVEGLVPMSELALERVEKVEDLLKVGDRFPATVIRIEDGGRKIALSRKNALPDPWRDHPDIVRPGAVVEGTVVSKEIGKDAGLRVEIAPGIVGSIRDSDANPDEYEIGERVEVTVKFVDRRTRRIRLGTAYATPAPSTSSSGFAPLGTELRRF